MDFDIHRLLYRNAELETELRLLKEQLCQAQNANSYLLGRVSSSNVAYQTRRPLLPSQFTYRAHSVEPESERADLLSFDEAHDSGYDESPRPLTSTATIFNASPVVTAKHVEKRRASGKENVERSNIPTHDAQDLIDHSDSEASPPGSLPRKLDLQSLRKRPEKDAVGLGLLNAHKSRSDLVRSAGSGEPCPRPANQPGFSITQSDGTVIWVPTGVRPALKAPETDVKASNTQGAKEHEEVQQETAQAKEQAESREEISEPPSASPTAPTNYPSPSRHDKFSHPPRDGGLAASRWSPYPQNSGPQTFSPQALEDLFCDLQNTHHHTLYRTVLITNIPSTTEITKLLAPTPDSATNISILKTVGMKTDPPMDTNTAMIVFENSVVAAKFADKCTRNCPFEFEAEVRLARTGTSGGEGKEKMPPRPQPLWVHMNAQRGDDGFERRGRAP